MGRTPATLALLSASLLTSGQPKPAVIIGGEEGQGAELGRVKDVAVVRNVLVVLEDGAPHLRVFGHDGRLRQTLGRAGAGPGEYRAPFTLAADPSRGEVLVVDPANGRLTKYSVSDTLAFVSTVPIDVPMPRAVCPNDARPFAVAGMDSVPVRVLEPKGGRMAERSGIGRTASRHPLAAHPLLQSYIADGPVLCALAQDRIAVGSALLGEVLLLRPSRPRETVLVSIPEFRPLSFSAVGDGLQLAMPPAGFYERLVGLRDRGGAIMATVARIEVEAPRSSFIRSYRVVEVRAARATIIGGARGWQEVGRISRHVVCFRQDPFPTITYWAQDDCP